MARVYFYCPIANGARADGNLRVVPGSLSMTGERTWAQPFLSLLVSARFFHAPRWKGSSICTESRPILSRPFHRITPSATILLTIREIYSCFLSVIARFVNANLVVVLVTLPVVYIFVISALWPTVDRTLTEFQCKLTPNRSGEKIMSRTIKANGQEKQRIAGIKTQV